VDRWRDEAVPLSLIQLAASTAFEVRVAVCVLAHQVARLLSVPLSRVELLAHPSPMPCVWQHGEARERQHA
jgi:hypothetical protein